MGYWIEFKGPALASNVRRLELVAFYRESTQAWRGERPGQSHDRGVPLYRAISSPVSQLISRATHTGQSFAEVIVGKDSEGRQPGVQYTLVLTAIATYSGPSKGRPAQREADRGVRARLPGSQARDNLMSVSSRWYTQRPVPRRASL